MLTRRPFHSATIPTFFKDYNSLLMLQSSPCKVNITSKIPKFIGFMKSRCRFSYSQEKKWIFMHLHIIRNIVITKNIFLNKFSVDYKLSKSSLFKVQAF